MSRLYDHPDLYEAAFAFRDAVHEADVLEAIMQRFSSVPVKRVLELACGHCPHAAELIARGYDYLGIDLNPHMLAYARRKLAPFGERAALIEANIAGFELPEPVDFAFVLLGSLYVTSTAGLESHYAALAKALRPGGLYFLDWCVDFDPLTDIADSWKAVLGEAKLTVTVTSRRLDRIEQTIVESVTVDVEENGSIRTYTEEGVKRVMYPQEFLMFIAAHPDFEFVGWWNDWDLGQPLDGLEPTNRPITVLRRV